MKKYGLYFLLIGLISDIIVPFILGIFVPAFNPIVNATSYLGELNNSISLVFKIWEIINGILFLLSMPAIVERFKESSKTKGRIVAAGIGIYGIGDCIFTGIFDHSVLNINGISYGTLIHRKASFIAYIGILIGMLALIKLYKLEKNKILENITKVNLILTILSTILYSTRRKEVLAFFEVNYRGLWQKIDQILLFAPFLIIAVIGIYNQNKKQKYIE